MRYLLVVSLFLAACAATAPNWRSRYEEAPKEQPGYLDVAVLQERVQIAQNDAIISTILTLGKRGWSFEESPRHEVVTNWRRIYIDKGGADYDVKEVQMKLHFRFVEVAKFRYWSAETTDVTVWASCSERRVYNWRTGQENWYFTPCKKHTSHAKMVLHSAEDIVSRLQQWSETNGYCYRSPTNGSRKCFPSKRSCQGELNSRYPVTASTMVSYDEDGSLADSMETEEVQCYSAKSSR